MSISRRVWVPPVPTCGVLNLSKPAGMTSRQVVDRVQAWAHPLKVGHAGTLDPIATGVLVVAVGGATRLIPMLQDQTKTYCGEFLLGQSSDTEDLSGVVQEIPDAPQPSRDELELELPRFLGEIEQIPPRYSAVHVRGKRAYQLARRGKSFELPSRKVMIHELEIVEYAYPRLTLRVVCGSGTYIRSLGRDLARAVGTEAVMASLMRTQVGPFAVQSSHLPEALDETNWSTCLIPAAEALTQYPRLELPEDVLWLLSRGRYVPRGEELNWDRLSGQKVTFCDEAGLFCGLGEVSAEGELQPRLMVSRCREDLQEASTGIREPVCE